MECVLKSNLWEVVIQLLDDDFERASLEILQSLQNSLNVNPGPVSIVITGSIIGFETSDILVGTLMKTCEKVSFQRRQDGTFEVTVVSEDWSALKNATFGCV